AVDEEDEAEGGKGGNERERHAGEPEEVEGHGCAVRFRHPGVILGPEEDGELALEDVPAHEPGHRLVGVQVRGQEVEDEDEDQEGGECPEPPVAPGLGHWFVLGGRGGPRWMFGGAAGRWRIGSSPGTWPVIGRRGAGGRPTRGRSRSRRGTASWTRRPSGSGTRSGPRGPARPAGRSGRGTG